MPWGVWHAHECAGQTDALAGSSTQRRVCEVCKQGAMSSIPLTPLRAKMLVHGTRALALRSISDGRGGDREGSSHPAWSSKLWFALGLQLARMHRGSASCGNGDCWVWRRWPVTVPWDFSLPYFEFEIHPREGLESSHRHVWPRVG